MKIEVVAFDWSGVLSDDRMPVYQANMRLMEHFGLPTMSFEEWLPRTKASAVEFLAMFGVHRDREELFGLYTRYFNEAIASGIVPTVYPHAQEVLSELQRKRKKIAVLSAHPEENLRREARTYGLEGLLPVILGNSKKKADGLRQLVTQFECSKEGFLYCGDTIYDIRSAKEAGVHSAGICGGYHTREILEAENPDIVGELPVLKQL